MLLNRASITKKIFKNFQSFKSAYTFSSSSSSTSTLSDLNIGLEKSEVGKKTVFFDFQSTTPLDPRVLDSMMPYMTVRFGNPHSKSHEYGWEAEKAVETAREVSSIEYMI